MFDEPLLFCMERDTVVVLPQASRLLQIGVYTYHGPHSVTVADEGLLESLAENVIFQVVTDWNMMIFYILFW